MYGLDTRDFSRLGLSKCCHQASVFSTVPGRSVLKSVRITGKATDKKFGIGNLQHVSACLAVYNIGDAKDISLNDSVGFSRFY